MIYEDFYERYPAISTAIKYSEETLKNLKADLLAALGDEVDAAFTIVTTGSFGRNEASTESDFDLFLFCEKEDGREAIQSNADAINQCIKRYVAKDTGSTGTFGAEAVVSFESLLKNIGGDEDTNKLLTRRMLFLLEGVSVYNHSLFESYRKTLINKYLKSSSDGKIDKYLLNDIIRYYRTITTDFQHKIDSDGKSWGVRNIKLRFSRKILYFAGIIALGYASDQEEDVNNRVNLLSSLLETPPLERIFEIHNLRIDDSKGHDTLERIFSDYNLFLESISDKEKRQSLENIKTKEQRLDVPLYTELSEVSATFNDNLYVHLKSLFDDKHKIHLALIF
ncbi:TPA: nucleotidyltransferase domain-containing protein [Klebsiella pneumoniae]|uniref:nucleotidyltransferase domain-containing protein n=1 Tax=Klebsiella TaxID=570 RepID=UPI000808D986|nr:MULTISPECIES: nucleotidyltransferase domain-containing protein [Klebsiella]HDS9188715.1 nucleotidyltransferase domain-containing protein [Klebsiella quasipneumoniae subsp. similipneumoniae]HDX8952759.1 nucleotidyltransferase domain-containing protein [Klebsiella michiganensis]EKZ2231317.1 nucleotidyltransferase domain-containing protein [Klebsiella pneumoniae]MBC4910643.1 nucleotidyltransferase domain-containing protein [Klebsiella pneumoniae]MBC4937471.1 nucleotidyltransferase domain-conta